MKISELKQIINKIPEEIEIFLKDEKKFKLFFFSLLIITVLSILLKFEWGIYILWWLLGFGWSLFFFGKKLNILENFLLGGIVFTIIFLVFLSIFAIVNIPINIFFFFLFVLISIVIFIKKNIFKEVNTKISEYDYIILFLFLISLFAKVFPLRNAEAAPLHDPISHAMMARNIIDTGVIEYFYSPGLHIISAFGELGGGSQVAKQVLILTAFYSAYSGIMSYFFVKHFFKNQKWAIITAVLFSSGYYPATLIFNAGKNALVMAIPILFFLMFVVGKNIKLKNWKLYVLANISLASLFLTHYPTAVIGAIFVGTVIIVFFKEQKWKGFYNVIGALFGLGWAARSYRYQILEMQELANPDRTSITYSSSLESVKDNIMYYLNSIKGTIITNFQSWNKFPMIISALGLLPLLYEIAKLKKKYIVLFLWIFFIFLFFLFLSILKIAILTILFETYLLSFSIFFYLLAGFFLSWIYRKFKYFVNDKKKWDYILIGFFLCAIIGASYWVYRKSQDSITHGNYVLEDDLVAFEWINENIPDEKKIINNAYENNDIIFSSDAGGYLEIFTGNEIAMPFYEFNKKETIFYYEQYAGLREDITECDYREEFLEDGYEYYYQGAYPFFYSSLAEQKILENTEGFEKVFEKGSAVLYRIHSCY